MKRFGLCLMASLALASCGDDAAPVEQGDEDATARGEVLGGTISDDMLPLDTVRSQAPSLAIEGAGEGEEAGTGASDAEGEHGHDHADYVLSGLPFSTLPDGVGPAIAAATYRVIRPGGAFLVYQFSAKARDFMARHFERIESGFEPLNVLPCQLFWGWKEPKD